MKVDFQTSMFRWNIINYVPLTRGPYDVGVFGDTVCSDMSAYAIHILHQYLKKFQPLTVAPPQPTNNSISQSISSPKNPSAVSTFICPPCWPPKGACKRRKTDSASSMWFCSRRNHNGTSVFLLLAGCVKKQGWCKASLISLYTFRFQLTWQWKQTFFR